MRQAACIYPPTQDCPGTDPGRWLFGFGKDVPPHQNTVGFCGRKRARRPGAAPSSCMI
jgi:hypothetical protein